MWCDVCMGVNPDNCPHCGNPPKKIECPKCKGYALVNCKAYNIFEDEIVDVHTETYLAIPDTEDLARYLGQKFCKHEADECPVCGGCGMVFDVNGEYYPAE